VRHVRRKRRSGRSGLDRRGAEPRSDHGHRRHRVRPYNAHPGPSPAVTRRGQRPRWRWWGWAVPGLLLTTAACGTVGGGATQETLVPAKGGTITVGIDRPPAACNPNTTDGQNW